mmetsp:Transcript_18779/g.47419  ORF Transcript_18779/g.47419 Transcript_18779/m.47419 type:complete len:234 (-) Transcript_18779:164-865(-)
MTRPRQPPARCAAPPPPAPQTQTAWGRWPACSAPRRCWRCSCWRWAARCCTSAAASPPWTAPCTTSPTSGSGSSTSRSCRARRPSCWRRSRRAVAARCPRSARPRRRGTRPWLPGRWPPPSRSTSTGTCATTRSTRRACRGRCSCCCPAAWCSACGAPPRCRLCRRCPSRAPAWPRGGRCTASACCASSTCSTPSPRRSSDLAAPGAALAVRSRGVLGCRCAAVTLPTLIGTQ